MRSFLSKLTCGVVSPPNVKYILSREIVPSSSLSAGTTTILKRIPAYQVNVKNVGGYACEDREVPYPAEYKEREPQSIGSLKPKNKTKILGMQ